MRSRVESSVGHPLSGGHIGRQGQKLGEYPGAGLIRNACDRGEQLELVVEFGDRGDELQELRLEFGDTAFYMADIDRGIVGDDPTVGSEALGGEMPVSLPGKLGIELPDAPGNMLYLEDFSGRWVPRLKGHAFEEFADSIGIEGIGFAALQLGGSEVLSMLQEYRVTGYLFGHRHRNGFLLDDRTAHVLTDNMGTIHLLHVYPDRVILGRKQVGSPLYEKLTILSPRG